MVPLYPADIKYFKSFVQQILSTLPETSKTASIFLFFKLQIKTFLSLVPATTNHPLYSIINKQTIFPLQSSKIASCWPLKVFQILTVLS